MAFVFGGSYKDLPDWYKDLLRSTIEQTEALRKQKYPVYEGRRIAPFTPYLTQSYKLARDTGEYKPYLKESGQLLRPSGKSYGEELEPYLNPYVNYVVENIGKEGERTFNEKILPSLEAKFVRLGQHGSSRHRGMAERLARDLQKEIMSKQQEALARGYSEATQGHHQAHLRNLATSRALGNLGLETQRARAEDIQLLNALGAQEQAHMQRELNEQQAEFWRRQMWPHQQLATQASMLHGVPMPMSQTYMQYEPPQPVPELSRMGQMGSLATQMYGMAREGRRFKHGGHVGLTHLSIPYRKKREK